MRRFALAVVFMACCCGRLFADSVDDAKSEAQVRKELAELRKQNADMKKQIAKLQSEVKALRTKSQPKPSAQTGGGKTLTFADIAKKDCPLGTLSGKDFRAEGRVVSIEKTDGGLRVVVGGTVVEAGGSSGGGGTFSGFGVGSMGGSKKPAGREIQVQCEAIIPAHEARGIDTGDRIKITGPIDKCTMKIDGNTESRTVYVKAGRAS